MNNACKSATLGYHKLVHESDQEEQATVQDLLHTILDKGGNVLSEQKKGNDPTVMTWTDSYYNYGVYKRLRHINSMGVRGYLSNSDAFKEYADKIQSQDYSPQVVNLLLGRGESRDLMVLSPIELRQFDDGLSRLKDKANNYTKEGFLRYLEGIQ